ncbi:MAG TPA: hypothetical protein VMR80_04075 [Candidatus Acidoferrum sp.]|jgi:hypothetical protein|nr:hypothetical protein [Candidatus Acidoferrum sp.]
MNKKNNIGGDSLRVGFGSIWITDYKKGLLLRIPTAELTNSTRKLERGTCAERFSVPCSQIALY